MFENISNQVMTILSLSVGGVSVASILGMIIYCIRLAIVNKKNLSVSQTTIENAFKEVVLPKNIKLDISNKIEKPIKEGLALASEKISEVLERVEKGEKLMMQILVLFTHYQKLPEDVREQIEDFINEQNSVDITL